MSRITISDLAIDSNSFINEVAETEAAFVNGGGFNFKFFGDSLLGLADFAKFFIKVAFAASLFD
ncbi:hypothetical protein NIES4075_58210 [Tolypothrix sp. NIES-4075]|uniref:hypothetical protein n=1 Tax=Tolypothrix sp. NIES-4075 TaxID=2005459 RepID=UPI000B5CB4EC|nr:hypothetical protein [Tolypothrix sp. NIES-4075]GAX44802.1 hypothetical protein NIES4075_58210 [Tolypothrix sp. NIES-4075]